MFRKLEVEVSANHSLFWYDEGDVVGSSLARALNSQAVALTGLMRYRATPLTAVTLEAETRTERFEFSPTRDNTSWSLVPGVEFGPRAIITGGAHVGYRHVRGLDQSLPTFSGPVGSVDLSHQLLGATTIGFTAQRDLEFSFSLLEPYYVAEGYGLSISQRLTRAFEMRFGIDYADSTYRSFQRVKPILS